MKIEGGICANEAPKTIIAIIAKYFTKKEQRRK
jgi:hypothetical protein